MKPFGPLMHEHRLIEKAVAVLKNQLDKLKNSNDIDKQQMDLFVSTSSDFFRIYADRCHHGKEENILFEQLKNKKLSEKHSDIMNRLIDEHKQAREMVKKLIESKNKLLSGQNQAVEEIVEHLDFLTKLYPTHIDTEDNNFFRPAMEYFSDEEQKEMLKQFYQFDRNMIHDKYKDVVDELESKFGRNI